MYPVDLIGSIYELLGIDGRAALPHPLGEHATAMPGPEDKVESAGLLREIM